MLLLELDIIKKKWVDKKSFQFKFNKIKSYGKKYKIKKIFDNIVYTEDLKSGRLSGFY